MASDQQAIQGLWRITSRIARGRPIKSTTTHIQFDANRVKMISPLPLLVEGGDWSLFELDQNARPKRFTMISERTGNDGRPDRRTDRWLYEIEGDVLRLCWPSTFGEYPDEFSDVTHSVEALVRDPGPPPQTKRPSGKKPFVDPVLGTLTWNDNLDWWDARLELRPGLAISVHVAPGAGEDDATAVATGRRFIDWLRSHEPDACRFAATKLLNTHNSSWNDEEPISAQAFAERMTLDAVGIDPEGSASLYYDDGDLFWGHCILVSVTKDREFAGANIAG